MIPNGNYRARPIAAALGETKNGAEQVGIEFEFLEGEGHRLTYYGSFSDKALEHTIKALRASGWQGVDLADLSSVGGAHAPEVSLVVENEEWEGQVRSKIRWVNPPGGLSVKAPLSAERAKAFAARMRGAVLAADKSAKASNGTRAVAIAPEPPPPTDSDKPPF